MFRKPVHLTLKVFTIHSFNTYIFECLAKVGTTLGSRVSYKMTCLLASENGKLIVSRILQHCVPQRRPFSKTWSVRLCCPVWEPQAPRSRLRWTMRVSTHQGSEAWYQIEYKIAH